MQQVRSGRRSSSPVSIGTLLLLLDCYGVPMAYLRYAARPNPNQAKSPPNFGGSVLHSLLAKGILFAI